MSVITVSKPWDEVVEALGRRRDLETVVLGCDKCAKLSRTGGADEVRRMRTRLEGAGVAMRRVEGLVDAVEEGLCDASATAQRLQPLRAAAPGCQILVLSCGAGLKCVRDLLPGIRLVPGLNTLGPGVKAELACVACGDCRFDEAGCRMLRLAEEAAARLRAGYGGGRGAAPA